MYTMSHMLFFEQHCTSLIEGVKLLSKSKQLPAISLSPYCYL